MPTELKIKKNKANTDLGEGDFHLPMPHVLEPDKLRDRHMIFSSYMT